MAKDKNDGIATRWRDVIDCIQRSKVDEISTGRTYDRVQKLLIQRFAPGCRFQVDYDGRVIEITSRERQVLHWISHGLSATEVAQEVGLSARTVEYYVANLKAKFNVPSKKQLLDVVHRHALLQKLK
jgi:DNA-binding CsgD family transcriptional regulator